MIFNWYAINLQQNLDEVQSWCREKNVAHIVLLKDTEAGSARLKTWEKDR